MPSTSSANARTGMPSLSLAPPPGGRGNRKHGNASSPSSRGCGCSCRNARSTAIHTAIHSRDDYRAQGLRLLVPLGHLFDDLEPAVRASFDRGVAALRAAGATIVERKAPALAAAQALYTLRNMQISTTSLCISPPPPLRNHALDPMSN